MLNRYYGTMVTIVERLSTCGGIRGRGCGAAGLAGVDRVYCSESTHGEEVQREDMGAVLKAVARVTSERRPLLPARAGGSG